MRTNLTTPMKIVLARMKESGKPLILRKDGKWQVDSDKPAPYHASWSQSTIQSLRDRGLLRVREFHYALISRKPRPFETQELPRITLELT